MGLVDPRRESPLESFSSGHMHLAGLPAPVLQAQVRTGSGVYVVDYLWEDFGVIGEADGEVKYTDPHAFIVEKEREGHLRDIGYEVVRWTGSLAFRAPHEMTGRIARARARAHRAAPASPSQSASQPQPACQPAPEPELTGPRPPAPARQPVRAQNSRDAGSSSPRRAL